MSCPGRKACGGSVCSHGSRWSVRPG
jgi:hypothetical protein